MIINTYLIECHPLLDTGNAAADQNLICLGRERNTHTQQLVKMGM